MSTSRPKWHLLYFVLAGFDLLTVSISLYLNHRLAGMYVESVQINQRWAERLGRYAKLGETANSVNAAANDVFETRDVRMESARMRGSLGQFRELMGEAARDVAENVVAGNASRLTEHLREITAKMDAQVVEGQQVFDLISAGNLTEAGASMARMDRQHAQLDSALNRLRAEVAGIQSREFQRQSEMAAALKLLEYVIAAAILIMVGGIALYGHHLARQASMAAQAREQQMAIVAQIATGVAHELRNPLTSIKMLLQSARERQEAEILPAEDFAIIEQEIRRMERCLQTFLDFARLPEPQRQRFDLGNLIDRSCRLIEGRAGRQSVTLEADVPKQKVLVDGDRDQIQQILLNLTLNSLDAMPHGGKLQIQLDQPTNGQVELRVCDTGTGISPALLPKLFEPFVTNKETGVGLGLVISRRIAEEHGGSLNASNRPDEGACFILRLPTGNEVI